MPAVAVGLETAGVFANVAAIVVAIIGVVAVITMVVVVVAVAVVLMVAATRTVAMRAHPP